MSKQTEAERLAKALEGDHPAVPGARTKNEAAAELRRLVSFNKDLMDEVARLNKIIDERKNKQHSLGYGEMELSLRRNHKDDLFECRRRFSAEEVMRGPDWLVEAAARSLDVQMNHAIQETENT